MRIKERDVVRIKRADIEKIKQRAATEHDLKSVAICNRALTGNIEATLTCQRLLDHEEEQS